MDAMPLTDLLLYDRMCERREERVESQKRYMTVSVGFSWMSCFWVLVPTLDKLISSKPDMWPALINEDVWTYASEF